jgi:hypothetical protein
MQHFAQIEPSLSVSLSRTRVSAQSSLVNLAVDTARDPDRPAGRYDVAGGGEVRAGRSRSPINGTGLRIADASLARTIVPGGPRAPAQAPAPRPSRRRTSWAARGDVYSTQREAGALNDRCWNCSNCHCVAAGRGSLASFPCTHAQKPVQAAIKFGRESAPRPLPTSGRSPGAFATWARTAPRRSSLRRAL